ncbi:MAG TPA: GNAT family N-acetyltransferase [Holophagaceae bacterium]|nr:GNAT family N-acetyltransferase [Holophagaceae bacterium]
MTLELREATPADAARVAALARQSFTETFAEDNNPGDLALFLDSAYGEAQQGAELQDPAWTTWIASVDGVPLAFAQLKRGPAEACVTGPAPVELNRLYVLAAAKGQGLGKALMGTVIARAKAEGFRTLWLGVWEHNTRAQAFYRRWPFVDVGSHTFVVGTDPQIDRIWECPI